MDTQFIVRELTLFAITALGWIIGYLEHKSPTTRESVRFPSAIRILLGKIEDNEFSIRGALLQLFMYSLFLYVTLYNLGKLSPTQMIRATGLTGLVLLALLGFRYLKKNG